VKTVKPQKLGVLCRTMEVDRKTRLVVTLLVCFPLDAPRNVLTEVEMWKSVTPELGEGGILDEGWPKARGEVLVTGRCFVPGGKARSVCNVRVKLGSVEKRLAAIGDRVWKDGVPTEPAPFVEMPIDWAHAFGGEGYADNPLGKGAAPVAGPDGKVHPLPNIELADRLVRSPKERPRPAGFGPVPLEWPQRRAKAGTFGKDWLAKRSPGLPKDADPGFYNAAPEDQQAKGYFRGDEAFVLENMHPDRPRIEGRLPGLVTRAFVTRKTPKGDVFGEIPTHLDTVRFFPRAERGLLVYRGTIEIADDDAADVLHLVAACEDAGAPKGTQHYRDVLAARLDRKKGLLEALRETALMPAAGGGLVPTAPKSEMAVLLGSEDLVRKNARRRAEGEIAALSARLESQGIRPADHGVLPLPPDEEPPGLEDPDAMVTFLETQQAAAAGERAGAEAKRAQLEARLRELCKKAGKDYDEVVKQGGGPPKFSPAQQLRTLPAGIVLADPTLPQKLAAMDERLKDAYRKAAHEMPAALVPDAATRARLGATLLGAVANGEDLAGRDFTGAELSGKDLRGAKLRGVFLEGANLSGADLSGADLSDAVLARANLGKTNLASARLAGANLGAARAQGAEFSGADLSRAVLVRSELDGARLAGATLDGTDFTETRFGAADLSGAKAAAFRVIKADLSGVKLSSIRLEKALFLEVDLTGADLTGAVLDQASFVTCRGEGAVFQRASLRRAVFVERSSFPRADFREATLTGANFRGTVLDRCRFEGARMAGADLSECSLKGATLEGAAAPTAMLVRADLTGAKVAHANLMEAVLQKATLAGADLSECNLFRSDLSRVRVDRETKLDRALLKQARIHPRSAEGPDGSK
jgi:uncharacterized protein YjbI with pentapeptide repeats